MKLPREKFIIFLAGYLIDKTYTTMDWIITIDQFLTNHNQLPMNQEERGFIHAVYDEAWLLMKSSGSFNRAKLRMMGKKSP